MLNVDLRLCQEEMNGCGFCYTHFYNLFSNTGIYAHLTSGVRCGR